MGHQITILPSFLVGAAASLRGRKDPFLLDRLASPRITAFDRPENPLAFAPLAKTSRPFIHRPHPSRRPSLPGSGYASSPSQISSLLARRPNPWTPASARTRSRRRWSARGAPCRWRRRWPRALRRGSGIRLARSPTSKIRGWLAVYPTSDRRADKAARLSIYTTRGGGTQSAGDGNLAPATQPNTYPHPHPPISPLTAPTPPKPLSPPLQQSTSRKKYRNSPSQTPSSDPNSHAHSVPRHTRRTNPASPPRSPPRVRSTRRRSSPRCCGPRRRRRWSWVRRWTWGAGRRRPFVRWWTFLRFEGVLCFFLSVVGGMVGRIVRGGCPLGCNRLEGVQVRQGGKRLISE